MTYLDLTNIHTRPWFAKDKRDMSQPRHWGF